MVKDGVDGVGEELGSVTQKFTPSMTSVGNF